MIRYFQFLKIRLKVNVKVMSWKILVPTERSLPWGIHMCNMNALSVLVQKLCKRLILFKSRSEDKVKVTLTGLKLLVQTERSCHKEYTLCNMKALSFWFKSYSQRLIFFFKRSKGSRYKCNINKVKIFSTVERFCHKELTYIFVCNIKALSLLDQKL